MQKQKNIHKDSESWYKDRGGQRNKKKREIIFLNVWNIENSKLACNFLDA
jgi:hypothetical protein